MKRWQAPAFGFVVAILLLFPWLGSVPGLHRDEAWVGLRAHEILGGARPVIGMTGHTGALHQYLVAPLVAGFGYRVEMLRLPTVLAAVGSLWLYFLLIRRLFDREIAALAALALAYSPFFLIYSRMAGENFALNPVLALGAALLLVRATEFPSTRRRGAFFFAGVLLGLGVWNHLIFISVVLGYFAVALLRCGRSLFLKADLAWVACGLGVALAPRILFSGSSEAAAVSLAGMTHRFFSGFREWVGLVFSLGHGDLLYHRVAGEVRWATPNFTAVLCFLGGAALLWNWRRLRKSGSELGFFTAFVAIFCLTLFVSPASSDRYFLLILYFLPVFAAHGFVALRRLGLSRRVVVGLFAGFLALQSARSASNYYLAHRETGGVNSKFRLGSLWETSNHFVSSESLYRTLVTMGAKHVWGEAFITEPLRFYDLSAGFFATVNEVKGGPAPSPVKWQGERSLAVLYASGLREARLLQFPGAEPVLKDAHFILLRSAAF